jgi:hypothetical protein
MERPKIFVIDVVVSGHNGTHDAVWTRSREEQRDETKNRCIRRAPCNLAITSYHTLDAVSSLQVP